jgi:DNA invertase Pin-like site-specific DNA recombinase
MTDTYIQSINHRTGNGFRARIGREYLRVSYDRSGRERSQDEQHDENVSAAEGIGVTLGLAYREAGSASASRYARKTRDDFARLLADLAAGRFGAEVLILWESSRGSRKVGEWVELIDLCEQQAVTIFVTTHGREYRPGNARDRRSMLEDAVDSEYESAKGSARGKRAAEANAHAGMPHGRIAFGYIRRYDERTRRMVAQEPHPEEAPVVLELFLRLKEGHSFKAIARDFAARGITNDQGRPFSAQHLRNLALNPTYSGVRVHRTKEQEKTRNLAVVDPDVFQTEATWPGLVKRADFLAVQRILCDPKRRSARPGGAKHLLSMIAKCDVCGAVLSASQRQRPEMQYWCSEKGHVSCNKAKLDAYAETFIVGYLARPEIHTKISTNEEVASAGLAQVREALSEARAELAKLRAGVAAKKLSVDTLLMLEPGMVETVTTLEATEEELTTPSALRGLFPPGGDVQERWKAAPVSTRRALARILLTPEILGELRVTRCPPGRRPHPSERVNWVRTRSAA